MGFRFYHINLLQINILYAKFISPIDIIILTLYNILPIMHCPFCSHENSIVKDSRETEGGKVIRRRRACVSCNKKFSTYEQMHQQEFMVIKRSGIKKPFDIDKVKKSISVAVRKRNVTEEQIDRMVKHVATEVESNGKKDTPTRRIGDLIMKELSQVDQVAYIRFASVYKDFCDTQDFMRLINRMKY